MEQEHKQFLNDLQESGLINMFGAVSSLQEEFDLNKHDARSILKEWMDNFV